MNNELKSKLNGVYGLCDELDGLGYGIGFGHKERDNLRVSFIIFVLYFANANGGITDEGTAFVKDYFDQEMSREMMAGLYKTMCEDNIVYQDSDFASKVPACIESYVATDNKIYANSNDNTKSVAGDVAEVFNLMGSELLSGADSEAKKKFEAFMNRILDYIGEKLAYDYRCGFERY